jgi:hypothetical protein
MTKTKIIMIILSTLILFLCSKSNPVSAKLFNIEYLEEQDNTGVLEKFLSIAKLGNPVTTQDCLPASIFKVSKINLNPTELIKGQNIHIKVIGAMMQDEVVSKLHIDAFLNGSSIYNQDVVKNQEVKKGLWYYEYEVGIPTFVPAGHWDIYIYVLNDKGEKLNCLQALFDA